MLVLLCLGVLWWCIQLNRSGGQGGRGEVVGTVGHPALTEISGIAVSRQNPGVIWAHNDSGDLARVFAMRTDGTHLGVFQLAGARAIDYEDMAIGPGPEPDVEYLYVADTGNNNLTRRVVTVYRAREPAVAADGSPIAGSLDDVETLPMRFPDRPHECETLLVDPLNGDLYLVTRDREAKGSGFSLVFRYSAPQQDGVEATLELVARFAAPVEIRGGDLSPDGSLILLRTHGGDGKSGALLWQWDRARTLGQVFGEPGKTVPMAWEPQGEAVAFTPDGRSFYSIGEGVQQSIYQYRVSEEARGRADQKSELDE